MECNQLYFETKDIKDAIVNFYKGTLAVDKHLLCPVIKESLNKALQENANFMNVVIEAQSNYSEELQEFVRLYVQFTSDLRESTLLDKPLAEEELTSLREIVKNYTKQMSKLEFLNTRVLPEFKAILNEEIIKKLSNVSIDIPRATTVGNMKFVLIVRLNRGMLPNPTPEDSSKPPLYICSTPFTTPIGVTPGVVIQQEIKVWITSVANFVLWDIITNFMINRRTTWTVHITTKKLPTILNSLKLVTLSDKDAVNSYNHYMKIELDKFRECLRDLVREISGTLKDDAISAILDNVPYGKILIFPTKFVICIVERRKEFKSLLVLSK